VLLGLTTSPGPPRPAANAGSSLPNPLFGVTISDISNISHVVQIEQTLAYRPTTRVYFDVKQGPGYYSSALSALQESSFVMGELLDSADEESITRSDFQTRVQSYVNTLGSAVDIWEVGNEVNGSWTGPYSGVSAKLTDAYNAVAAVGGLTALTLYANDFGPDNCGDGASELTPAQFTQQYVPRSVANGLNYVLLSYYPTECEDIQPSAATVRSYMQQLHALYPSALLGFGEVGLRNATTTSTMSSAQRIMAWSYGLDPGLSYYIGGYFWWYGLEDCFSGTELMLPSLLSAFASEAAAIGVPITPTSD
jgi:hypothetical protein